MIKEVAPEDIADGIHEVMTGDGIVLRGLIDVEQAAFISELVPQQGVKRVYLSPWLRLCSELKVPSLDTNRRDINKVITSYLGKRATLWGNYVLLPDMLRAGETHPHVDGRVSIVSASLNLDNGNSHKTSFFARRVAAVDEPYSEIKAAWEQDASPIELIDTCELYEGDMVIVSRGVAHGSFAGEDRRSITYRTRGLISSDFH